MPVYLVKKENDKIILRKEDNSPITSDEMYYFTYPRPNARCLNPITCLAGVKVLEKTSDPLYDEEPIRLEMTPTAFVKSLDSLLQAYSFVRKEDEEENFNLIYHENNKGVKADFNYNKPLYDRVSKAMKCGYIGEVTVIDVSKEGLNFKTILSDDQSIGYLDEITEKYVEKILNRHKPLIASHLRFNELNSKRNTYLSLKDEKNLKTRGQCEKEIIASIEKNEKRIVKNIFERTIGDKIKNSYDENLRLKDLEFKDEFVGLDCGFNWIEVRDPKLEYSFAKQGEANCFNVWPSHNLPYFNSSFGHILLNILIDTIQDDLDYKLIAIRHLD